jgi:hypothetical protein
MFKKFHHFGLQIFRNHFLSLFESNNQRTAFHLIKLYFLMLFLSIHHLNIFNSIINYTSHYQIHIKFLTKYYYFFSPKHG